MHLLNDTDSSPKASKSIQPAQTSSSDGSIEGYDQVTGIEMRPSWHFELYLDRNSPGTWGQVV